MQYPVPQFTDVEDKIIAGLSLRQFMILFGAGVLIFLFYSASKNIIGTIILFLIVGLPAVIVAFVRINGRPLYKTIGHLILFFTHPRELLFHKQGLDATSVYDFKAMDKPKASEIGITPTDHSGLKDLALSLEKQRQQESQLVNNQK